MASGTIKANASKADIENKAETIYLTTSDDTWAEIYEKISALPLAKPATLYVHANAISALTGGAQTTGAWGGIISRTGTGAFSLILKSTGNQLRAAYITGASGSSSGTYTEVNYYNKADGYVTLTGSSGTNTYAIAADSRIRIDLITTNAARMGTILVSGNSAGTAAYFKADVGGSVSVTANGANLIIETNNSISLFCTVYAGSITKVTT